MYIRCGSCRTSTRVPLVSARASLTCASCGRVHELNRALELGATPRERCHKAQAFAEQHGMDLASAYSVLLGVMSLEEAAAYEQSCPGSDSTETAQRYSRPDSPLPADTKPEQRTPSYDPGFHDAIAGGFLTIRMAVERGDRVIFASRLARRHGIPLALAFEVTDNTISLRDARVRVASKKAQLDVETPLQPGAQPRSRMLGYFAILFAVVGAYLLGGWVSGNGQDGSLSTSSRESRSAGETAPGRVAPMVQSVTAIRSDADGRLTQLIGPTPDWVLKAFCASGLGSTGRVPVRVEKSVNGSLGIFRESGKTSAITILEDDHSNSWVAGNGADPIRAIPTSL